MSESNVELEIEDRQASVTFARPDHNNAVTLPMLRSLSGRITEAEDAGCDILLVKAQGSHFSIGRDREEDLDGVTRRDVIESILDANENLANFDGVTIAIVHGRTLGFGCGIAVQSDFTVASDTAVLGFDEVKEGLVPKIVMSYLETYVGRKTAIDLILTGRKVPAVDALNRGLVTNVVPEDQLEVFVDGLVDHLLGLNADNLRECKFYFRDVEGVSPAERRSHVLDAML